MDKHLSRKTMVGPAGRKFIEDILRIIFNQNIQGDFVQCGVWRGGIAGLMLDHILKSEIDLTKSTRKLWLYDTFEGMPPPGENDPSRANDYYLQTKNIDNEFSNWCKASIEDVIETLKYVSQDYDYYTKLIQGKVEETFQMVDRNPDDHWYDAEGHQLHEDRIQEGLDLFGKYFRALWD